MEKYAHFRASVWRQSDGHKLRTSTKEEMDRPLSTETEYAWNIYTHVFIIVRCCVLCVAEFRFCVFGNFFCLRMFLFAKHVGNEQKLVPQRVASLQPHTEYPRHEAILTSPRKMPRARRTSEGGSPPPTQPKNVTIFLCWVVNHVTPLPSSCSLPSQLCSAKIMTDPQQSLVHVRSQTGMTYSSFRVCWNFIWKALINLLLLLSPLFSKHGVWILCTALWH